MAVDNDLKGALCDVRKSFRLVWLYQRRVLDIAKIIVEQFDDASFLHWAPCYFDYPSRSKDPTENWAADYIPFYDFSLLYLFSDRSTLQKGDWMLEIRFTADFPYSDTEVEPNPTEFEPCEKSQSLLRLYAWACTKTTNVSWKALWDGGGLEWPKKEYEQFEALGINVLKEESQLDRMPDEKAVINIADEFKKKCRVRLGKEFKLPA